MKRFNINDHVYVQITDAGWEHLIQTQSEEYIRHCVATRRVTIDGQDWHRLQCHQVFELFPVGVGRPPLFGTTVLIDDDNIDDK